METESIKEELERYKIKAELFLKNNLKAFIKDISDNYYFCHIIFAGEDCLHVQHFKGKKKLEKEKIYYVDIVKFVEYNDSIGNGVKNEMS